MQPAGKTSSRPESKGEKFRRLAEARTKAVLQKLKVLGNCANRAAYEYSPNEVDKIFRAIEVRFKEVRSKFTGASAGDEFTL